MYIFRSQPIIKLSNKKAQNLFEKLKIFPKLTVYQIYYKILMFK